MDAPTKRPLWKRLVPWIVPPLFVVLVLWLLLLYFEAAPPVPFHYTSP